MSAEGTARGRPRERARKGLAPGTSPRPLANAFPGSGGVPVEDLRPDLPPPAWSRGFNYQHQGDTP